MEGEENRLLGDWYFSVPVCLVTPPERTVKQQTQVSSGVKALFKNGLVYGCILLWLSYIQHTKVHVETGWLCQLELSGSTGIKKRLAQLQTSAALFIVPLFQEWAEWNGDKWCLGG